MPLPTYFAEGDPSEARISSYFEEMYDFLLDAGVPEDRLPSPWHMLSRIVKCVDPELVREWLDLYVNMEAEMESILSSEDDDEDDSGIEDDDLFEAVVPKHRPSYLKVIDSTAEDHNEVAPDGT